jgi:nitrate reductase gamma subunit
VIKLNSKSKVFIGILLIVVGCILGLLVFGGLIANSYTSVDADYTDSSMAYILGVVAVVILVAGIGVVSMNVELAKTQK